MPEDTDFPTLFKPSAPYRFHWLTMAGQDAADFLQRLTTLNINRMQPGKGSDGFILNAQGKIEAVFTLWRYGEEEFAFECPDNGTGEWRKRLLETIDRFTFGEKFALAAPGEELDQLWLFGNAAAGLDEGRTEASDEEIRVCRHRDAVFGRPWATAWGRPARLSQWADRLGEEWIKDPALLTRWRVRECSPWAGFEITAGTNPLEVGESGLVHSDKGCYPGQEVLEKILAYGSPPKRLVRIGTPGAEPESGMELFNEADPPQKLGRITSISDEELALAVVTKIHAKKGLEVKLGESGPPATILSVSPHPGEA